MLKPATPLTIALLISFVLLLLSTLSTPVIKSIPLATFQGVNFGVFGYCAPKTGCTSIRVGYTTGTRALLWKICHTDCYRWNIWHYRQWRLPTLCRRPTLAVFAPCRTPYRNPPQLDRVGPCCGSSPSLAFSFGSLSTRSADPSSAHTLDHFASISCRYSTLHTPSTMGRMDRPWLRHFYCCCWCLHLRYEEDFGVEKSKEEEDSRER